MPANSSHSSTQDSWNSARGLSDDQMLCFLMTDTEWARNFSKGFGEPVGEPSEVVGAPIVFENLMKSIPVAHMAGFTDYDLRLPEHIPSDVPIERDIYFKMPPLKKYQVDLDIKSVNKGQPQAFNPYDS